ncbi:cell envelope biogenesis protein TolA [Bradyrhizobium genosp. A]|uniref:cell envelope biogenesis protein TolA n=1 Tax=Bradyrhizobium genosp. A TaxID=83626 RepID=UPI003CE97E2F
MVRKLKTFQTSLGFYDLAIAAPSMKAALDAWGAGSNLFHQGVAKEADDPDVVAATMSKPGVVLKRPAGSNGRFAEHSDLPTDLGSGENRSRRERHRPKPVKRAALKIGERESRKAAADFEERKRREAERRREEAARERDRERRKKAMDKAQAALDKAEREHGKKAAAIQAELETIEKRSRAEDDRWKKERERLQAALQRARD